MGFTDTQSSQSVESTLEYLFQPARCPQLRHKCPGYFNPDLKPNAGPETTDISCTNLLLIGINTLSVISRYLVEGGIGLFVVVDITRQFTRKLRLFY